MILQKYADFVLKKHFFFFLLLLLMLKTVVLLNFIVENLDFFFKGFFDEKEVNEEYNGCVYG